MITAGTHTRKVKAGRARRSAKAVPNRVNDMRPYLDRFTQAMLYKLNKNGHKRPPSYSDIHTYLRGMQTEALEALDQFLRNPKSENLILELADVANFAFLMAMVTMIENDKVRQ